MSAEYELSNHVCPHCKSVYRAALVRCALDGHELVPFEADPLIGKQFADRYVIEECIGVGGMGRVYRARHQNVSRRFAVKVLFGELASDRTMRARFAREAEAASRLDHPNVVPVVDFGQTGEGLLYLVMDFVEGPTLRELMTDKAPIAPASVIDLSMRLARGLGHAHKLGMVHRDFKPGNVIIQERDDELVPRIVDFGIAMLDDPSATGSRLTQSGAFIGTPACMAPEQAAARAVDHRADLYSLGVTMYEMLTGKPPYDGPGMEVIHQHCLSPFPPMSERAPEIFVPVGLEDVVRALMEKKPEDRPESARELITRLKAVALEDTQVSDEPPNTPVGATLRIAPGDSGPNRRALTPMPPTSHGHMRAPTPLPPTMPPAHRATTPLSPGSYPGPMPPGIDDSAPHLRALTPSPMSRAAAATGAGADEGRARSWIAYMAIAGLLLGVAVTGIAIWGRSDDAGEPTVAQGLSADNGDPTADGGAAVGEATGAGQGSPKPEGDDDSPTPDTPPKEATIADADAAVAAAADAAPTRAAEVDAGVADTPQEDAEPTKKQRKVVTRPVRTRPTTRPRIDAKKEVSREQFLSRYRSVGALLLTLNKANPSAANPLRARYKRISPQASLRSAEVRASSYSALGKIRSSARAAMKRTK